MATSTKDPVPEAVRKAEGDALRRLFEQAKMSQPQVAERSGVGSKAFVSQLLTGHRPLNIEQATKIAEVIGRKIDEFSPRLANQIRAAAALVDMLVLTGDTVAVPVTKSTISIDRTGIHHTPEVENKIVVMNGNASSTWPFQRLTPEQYKQISPEGRTELETLARGMFLEATRQLAKAQGG